MLAWTHSSAATCHQHNSITAQTDYVARLGSHLRSRPYSTHLIPEATVVVAPMHLEKA